MLSNQLTIQNNVRKLLKAKCEEVYQLTQLLSSLEMLERISPPARLPCEYTCNIEPASAVLFVESGHCTTKVTFVFDR